MSSCFYSPPVCFIIVYFLMWTCLFWGLPTIKEQKNQELLRKAWNVDGSPFKGTQFDPKSVKFCWPQSMSAQKIKTKQRSCIIVIEAASYWFVQTLFDINSGWHLKLKPTTLMDTHQLRLWYHVIWIFRSESTGDSLFFSGFYQYSTLFLSNIWSPPSTRTCVSKKTGGFDVI